MLSQLTQQLIDALAQLPGIGPRTAQRMAFQLLSSSGKAKGLALAHTLKTTLEKIGYCEQCHTYTEHQQCQLCSNPKRDRQLLCVVETPADQIAIEQTHAFQGLYFILQGHLSPLDGIGPEQLGIAQLLHRIEQEDFTEVIIATNSTAEGEATAHYLGVRITKLNTPCTRIAHGVPVGGELEYLDGNTLAFAVKSRAAILTETE